MKRLRCIGTVSLTLLVGCASFHIPNTLSSPPIGTGCRFPTPESRLTPWSRPREPGAQANRHWKAPRLRALTSSGDVEQLQKVDESSSDDSYAVDDTPTFTPNILWWTKSRAEEDATLNLGANAGFIAAVVIFAVTTVFTIDMEISRGWTTGEFLLRVPVDNWLAYMGVLRDNPVLVKACTSGIVYTLGDWTAQTFEGTALADIKRGRVARSAMAGLLLHGPLSHIWYDLCEGAFDFIGWNDYWWVAGPKVVTDQILWGPFWNAVYICFLGVLKRDSFETIREAVVTTALPLVIAGIRLWPLAHLVTYGLIPTENRLLWVDFVEIIWVTILSKQAADQARASKESTVASEVHNEPEAGMETETTL